jgi:hypothetical protein
VPTGCVSATCKLSSLNVIKPLKPRPSNMPPVSIRSSQSALDAEAGVRMIAAVDDVPGLEAMLGLFRLELLGVLFPMWLSVLGVRRRRLESFCGTAWMGGVASPVKPAGSALLITDTGSCFTAAGL